jgi:hypothetical protein
MVRLSFQLAVKALKGLRSGLRLEVSRKIFVSETPERQAHADSSHFLSPGACPCDWLYNQ